MDRGNDTCACAACFRVDEWTGMDLANAECQQPIQAVFVEAEAVPRDAGARNVKFDHL